MSKAIVQYLGYAGHSNLGDDVIRQVFVDALPQATFSPVPAGRDELIRRSVGHWLASRRQPLLLGGGTLVGREAWREHIERANLLFRPSGFEMLGVGVEDPSFSGTRTYTTRGELRRWRDCLSWFRAVTVRGPRSVELLAEIGIDAKLVGDPALLLSPEEGVRSDLRVPRVLVNVTRGEDQWGGLDLDWTGALVETLRSLLRDGVELRFLAMEPSDAVHNRAVASRLGLEGYDEVAPTTAQSFFGAVTDVGLVIGTRLHCNILAAAAHVPNISLEYRPKCRDFMESVDQGSLCFRVDRLEKEQLLEAVTTTMANAPVVSEQLETAVAVLRGRLETEMKSVTRALLT